MSPEQSRLIAVLSASNFVIGMGAFVVIGVLTPLARGLQVPPEVAGQLLTVYALSYAVLSPLLVSFTGRIGRRRVLTFGLSVFTLGAALSALSPSLSGLQGARILAAAGAGMFTPVAATVAAGLSPPETRARVLAAVFFGLTLSQVAGVPVGSALAYAFGWRWAFVAVAAVGVPCIWLVWHTVPAGLRFQPVSLRDLGRVLVTPPLMIAVLFTASFLGAMFVVFTYLAPMLEELVDFGPAQVTAALIVAGAAAVLGNLMGGWLADRLGPERTLILLSVALIGALSSLSLWPLPVWVVFAQVFLWNLFSWSFGAAQQVRLIRLDPAAAPVLLSLNAACIYIGAALGSAIGGAVLAGFGFAALGPVGAAMTALALLHLLASIRLSRAGADRAPDRTA